MPYANSLDPDDMPSDSGSYPDPSCLTLRSFKEVTLVALLTCGN